MTDITADCTIIQAGPTLEAKVLVIQCPASTATGDEIDVADHMTTILVPYICDATGVVKTATFSGTVISLGTVTTGVHAVLVFGLG